MNLFTSGLNYNPRALNSHVSELICILNKNIYLYMNTIVSGFVVKLVLVKVRWFAIFFTHSTSSVSLQYSLKIIYDIYANHTVMYILPHKCYENDNDGD